MLKCFSCAIVTGVFLITVGILCLTLVPWLVEETVRASVKMETPTSSLYDSFKNSSAKGVEVYKTYYMFHVANPWAVQNLGAVPQLEKRGPFSYREYETYNESVTTWHPNATFTYRSFTTYEFQPQMSDDEMQVVTVPRASYFAIIKTVKVAEAAVAELVRTLFNTTSEAVLRHLLDPYLVGLMDGIVVDQVTLLQNSSIFINKTVREIIRTGYADDLVTQFEDVLTKMAGGTPSSKKVKIALMPDDTPEDYDDPSLNNEAYTGGQPSSTQPPIPNHAYRRMTKWHGSPTVNYWGTAAANQIDGTDATAFHPMVKKGESLQVWVNALVRKVWLTFQKEVSVKGVKCYRHIIDPEELAANENNAVAYYMNTPGWLPSPPLELFKPINYTKALFLDAQLEGVVNVTGLDADLALPRDELETFLDIEPMTGGLFQVHKRLQANIQLAPMQWTGASCSTQLWFQVSCNNSIWAPTANLPTTMVPFTYLDQHMVLPDSIVQDLKDLIFTPLLVAKVMGGIGVAVGIVIIIASIVVFCLRMRRERRDYQDHEFYHFINETERKV